MNQNKKKILENWFVNREGKKILKTLKEVNLVDSGLLDSLDILTLALFLEKKFNCKIDISKPKILKNFEKFENLLKMIK